jgi:hypothetical protein
MRYIINAGASIFLKGNLTGTGSEFSVSTITIKKATIRTAIVFGFFMFFLLLKYSAFNFLFLLGIEKQISNRLWNLIVVFDIYNSTK